MGGAPFKLRSSYTETFRKIMEEEYQFVAKIFDKHSDRIYYRLLKSLDDNPIKEELAHGYEKGDFSKIEIYKLSMPEKVKDVDLDSIPESS